jgi:hypothetical protein
VACFGKMNFPCGSTAVFMFGLGERIMSLCNFSKWHIYSPLWDLPWVQLITMLHSSFPIDMTSFEFRDKENVFLTLKDYW